MNVQWKKLTFIKFKKLKLHIRSKSCKRDELQTDKFSKTCVGGGLLCYIKLLKSVKMIDLIYFLLPVVSSPGGDETD